MDLKPLEGKLHSRYLKGRVMDSYNGGVWSSARQGRWFHTSPRLEFDFWEPKDDAEVYSYQLEMEPMVGNTIFFFNTLITLQGRLHPLRIEGPLNNMSVSRNKTLTITYMMSASDQSMPNRTDYDQSIYLAVPENMEYMGQIAETVLAENIQAPIATRAGILSNYFLSNFTYSLDIDNAGQQDPLQYFLQTTQSGHCELFASSLVLMLRSQGIKARLVTGFLVPDLHPSGEFYYITESDAHAWVEYEDNGYWYIIDPTPPANFVSASFIETTLAIIERWWRNQVVTFDFETQKEFFASVLTNAALIIVYFKEKPWVAAILLAIFCVPMIFFRSIRLPFLRGNRVIRSYLRLERQLNRLYAERQINEGVYDYVRRLNLGGALEIDLLEYFHSYHAWRFGAQSRHSPTELVRMGRNLVKRLDQ